MTCCRFLTTLAPERLAPTVMPTVRSQPPVTITPGGQFLPRLAARRCARRCDRVSGGRPVEQVEAVLLGQENKGYPCRGECGSVLPDSAAPGWLPEAARTTPPARRTCGARHLR